jgi:hypothetical protein
MSNSLTAQSLFRNSAEYLEAYQVALENAAGQFNESTANPTFFNSQIQPILINDQAVRIYGYKRILSEMIIFNPVVKLNLARLAMASAVYGNNPMLAISIDTEGKLEPVSELDILQAVTEQFNDDELLVRLLNQNILKISVGFS